MIRILYFAHLRETLDCAEETLQTVPQTVAALRELLQQRGELWQAALSGNVLCAVNQTMAKGSTKLKTGDEVAFFPPVTGG